MLRALVTTRSPERPDRARATSVVVVPPLSPTEVTSSRGHQLGGALRDRALGVVVLAAAVAHRQLVEHAGGDRAAVRAGEQLLLSSRCRSRRTEASETVELAARSATPTGAALSNCSGYSQSVLLTHGVHITRTNARSIQRSGSCSAAQYVQLCSSVASESARVAPRTLTGSPTWRLDPVQAGRPDWRCRAGSWPSHWPPLLDRVRRRAPATRAASTPITRLRTATPTSRPRRSRRRSTQWNADAPRREGQAAVQRRQRQRAAEDRGRLHRRQLPRRRLPVRLLGRPARRASPSWSTSPTQVKAPTRELGRLLPLRAARPRRSTARSSASRP